MVTVIAVAGIAFGVMALTIVLSVTGGFQESFRDRILGLHPHIVVWSRSDEFTEYRQVIEDLTNDPNIAGATPATYDEMMIAHGDHRVGAVIKGTDYKSVESVLSVEPLLTEGELSSLDEHPIITRHSTHVELTGFVQETSWLILLWGKDKIATYPVDLAVPYPENARISVVNAAPNIGGIDVAMTGAKSSLTSNLLPGKMSLPLVVQSGSIDLNIGKQKLFQKPYELTTAGNYLLVVHPTQKVSMIPVNTERPRTGEARVLVVDARQAPKEPMEVRIDNKPIENNSPTTVPGRLPCIIIGEVLAKSLHAKMNDIIAVASPYRGLGLRGVAPVGMEPTSGRFRVSGLFKSGYHDYDKRFGLVPFSAALRFLNTGDRARWVEVRVDNILQLDERRKRVENILQPYSVGSFVNDVKLSQERVRKVLSGDVSQFAVEPSESILSTLRNSAQVVSLLRVSIPHTFDRRSSYSVITWDEINAPLFSALKLQKVVLSIFFLIIIVVAAFNIVGTQIMMVTQKTREIAILKAMGATRKSVKKAFLIQGLIVSLLGTTLGLIFGVGSCLLIDHVGYPLEPEVYLISQLPVTINPMEILGVAVATLLLTLAATLLSASRAGRMLPVHGIRYIE